MAQYYSCHCIPQYCLVVHWILNRHEKKNVSVAHELSFPRCVLILKFKLCSNNGARNNTLVACQENQDCFCMFRIEMKRTIIQMDFLSLPNRIRSIIHATSAKKHIILANSILPWVQRFNHVSLPKI